jgi:hypothetical protein
VAKGRDELNELVVAKGLHIVVANLIKNTLLIFVVVSDDSPSQNMMQSPHKIRDILEYPHPTISLELSVKSAVESCAPKH